MEFKDICNKPKLSMEETKSNMESKNLDLCS